MARSLSRQALPFVSGLFVACAVIQVFLAGLGVFDDPRTFITHREFGYAFGWLTLVILVLALVSRAPRRLVGLSVLMLGLFALQSVFVAVRMEMPALAALHPLNGFTILAVGVVSTRVAWQSRGETSSVPGTARLDRPAASGASDA